MKDQDQVTTDVLLDIAFRARLHIPQDQQDQYKRSFENTVNLLNSVSNLEVCHYKDYSVPPMAALALPDDSAHNNSQLNPLKESCQHINSDSHIIEFPKVIEEGS